MEEDKWQKNKSLQSVISDQSTQDKSHKENNLPYITVNEALRMATSQSVISKFQFLSSLSFLFSFWSGG
jgi:hypothetical protein